jgi:hypothetical protein
MDQTLALILAATLFIGLGYMDNPSQNINASQSDSNDAIFAAYQFPVYPNLIHLCQQRVYPFRQDFHLTWDAFASESEPSAIVDDYLEKLGRAGFSKEKEGGTWRFPINNSAPSRLLIIQPAEADGPHLSCDKKPPPNSRSVIILSRKDPF